MALSVFQLRTGRFYFFSKIALMGTRAIFSLASSSIVQGVVYRLKEFRRRGVLPPTDGLVKRSGASRPTAELRLEAGARERVAQPRGNRMVNSPPQAVSYFEN